jgi:hypothetical protein
VVPQLGLRLHELITGREVPIAAGVHGWLARLARLCGLVV